MQQLGRTIGVAHDYQELIAALRARQTELNVAYSTIDEVSGLPQNYVSKLLAQMPIKGLGRISLGPLLGSLGLVLIVAEDLEALQRVRSRLVPRTDSDLLRIESNRQTRAAKAANL